MATQEQGAEMLSRKDMTEILPGSAGLEMQGGTSYPQVIPNSPTFQVPANPLLPQDYNEVLDYNAGQYLNGIFRTQIGRYVKVSQLVGSNTLEEFEGYLIGVGINYIILRTTLQVIFGFWILWDQEHVCVLLRTSEQLSED